ncbi:MAG TPA: hypothetical protein VNG33_18275 [Polyangiaceae bacterium]|nr:hypothetical protein [Polyangiaceae bacterium]
MPARLASLAALLWFGWAREAQAYRPFDGTDADVAELGTLEVEAGPAQFYRYGGNNYLETPAAVLNVGFARNLEAIVDFSPFVGLQRVPGERRLRLLGTDALVKWVLWRGVLQGQRGPSVAFEGGPLLPEIHGESRFGAQARVIVSYAWPVFALHFNEQVDFARSGNIALFSGVILEGPRQLMIRPVAELFAAKELHAGADYSALLGAIWPVNDAITFDAGARLAREDGAGAVEARLGLTWRSSLWATPETPE